MRARMRARSPNMMVKFWLQTAHARRAVAGAGKGAVCAKKIGRRGSGPSSKASQCGTGASQDRAAGWFTAAFPTARPANVYP